MLSCCCSLQKEDHVALGFPFRDITNCLWGMIEVSSRGRAFIYQAQWVNLMPPQGKEKFIRGRKVIEDAGVFFDLHRRIFWVL